MRIGILSDTHDQLGRTRIAVDLLQAAGAEALIHCGDVTTAPIIAVCAVLPCWFVFGNNDADTVIELQQTAQQYGVNCLGWGGVVTLAGKRIGVTHGHMRSDTRRVLNSQPHFVMTGHSHQSHDLVDDDIRHINPGALHRADEFTVAVLNLANDELQWISVPR